MRQLRMQKIAIGLRKPGSKDQSGDNRYVEQHQYPCAQTGFYLSPRIVDGSVEGPAPEKFSWFAKGAPRVAEY